MKTNKRSAVVLSALAVVLTLAVASFAQGGKDFKPIENSDAGVDLAADFAVKERAAKTKTTITPATIVKAEDNEPKLGARNFRLCLKTTVNGKPETARTIISVDQYSNHKLISWVRSTCDTDDTAFKPIENGDGGAGLAADFAVKERAVKTKSKITPATIVKAEDQEFQNGARRNFRLCLKTTVNGKPTTAQTVINVDQYSNHKLISWTVMKCGEGTSGEFSPVEKTHAGLGLAADFAVKKHSEDTKIEHKLVEITKGEAKGMLATTFRICMKVSEEGSTQVIQAVVSMDQYSNMKLVSWKHSDCGN